MALPKISVPKHKLSIPSTKQEITYRPFLVREEKILLMAIESNDERNMADATKEIIRNCVYDDINVDTLTTFDIEYIFLQLKCKSKGEITELVFKCNKCKSENNVKINLGTIKVEFDKKHSNKIEIQDGIGIVMKYPNISMVSVKDESQTDQLFRILESSIDYIYDTDTTYKGEDQTVSELNEFIEQLPDSVFDKFKEFFNTMPKLKKEIKFACKKCKEKNKYTLEGLQSFLE